MVRSLFTSLHGKRQALILAQMFDSAYHVAALL